MNQKYFLRLCWIRGLSTIKIFDRCLLKSVLRINNAFVFVALVSLFLNLPASQAGRDNIAKVEDSCVDSLQSNRSGTPQPAGAYEPTFTRFEEIHPVVQEWIRVNDSTQRQINDYKFQNHSTVRINGIEIEIEAALGQGHDGEVYLVRNQLGFYVFKVFNSQMQLRFYQERVEQNPAADLPQIIEIDLPGRVALLEYVEGIPVDRLDDLHDTRLTHYLSQSEIDKIKTGWQPFEKQYWREHLILALSRNTIYSFKTNSFRVIDAE